MLKAIVASFIGTFLALAAIGVVAVVAFDRTVDRVVNEVAGRIEERLTDVRERASSAAAQLRERAGAEARPVAEALEAGRARRAALAAFGECFEGYADGGDRPAEAVRRCLDEVEP